jgi:hypothetical protein
MATEEMKRVNQFVRAACGAVLLAIIVTAARSGELPSVPLPEGFVESSSLVPALRDQALIGHPSGTRLIGVYLLPDELANILHGGSEHMTIFCRAYVTGEFGSEEEAKAFFRRMTAGAKQEASKKFDPSDPDVSRIIQRYIDATKERQGQTVSMTGATSLGSILETEDIYASSMIVVMSAETEQGQVSIPIAAAVAWVRLGKQVLELSDLAQFLGGQSIITANSVVLDWVKAFASARTN